MSDDKKYTYFDDTTNVLAPIFIILAITTVILLLFVL